MKSNRRTPGGAPRAASGRPGSGAGMGLWIVLVGAPLVIFGVIFVLKGKEPPPAPAPVVLEKEEYDRSKRLRDQAQAHISGFFRAKRDGDSERMAREFDGAKEKLEAAQTILETLKKRYTDDGTLDGNLPDEYYYLDQELAELSEDYIQIIREKDVGE